MILQVGEGVFYESAAGISLGMRACPNHGAGHVREVAVIVPEPKGLLHDPFHVLTI